MRKLRACRTWSIVLFVLAGAVAGAAQNIQINTRNEGMTTQYVKTGLYVISGRGSNSVLRLSANGLLLVDGKLPGGYDVLLGQVKRVSKQPVRALILTSFDESATGTNAKFLENGTTIIVQENARPKLASSTPADTTATPVVTYTDEYRIHLGGVDAQLMHFGNAHSNSDTVVYFPNLKAVAVGDLFASTPNPDFSAGGSLVGWGPALAQVLKLDFDVVIPSTGPTVTRADLEAFKVKIDTLISRATALVNEGVAKEQLMSQWKTDDLGWQFSFTPDQVDSFYAELSRPR
jgi:glyoxylase-like metal-dependent hydrolase (beta-lactamase superfamily II)